MASRSASGLWVAVLACVASLYVACLGGLRIHPAFGDGPSIYIVSAQSIAHGTGYRLINYPSAPPAQLYPIGYPLLLSFIFRVMPFGRTSIFLARLLNVAAAVLWVEAARRLLSRAVNPLLGAMAALAMGLAPLLLEMNGQVKADVIFGAILVIAIVVAVSTYSSDSARRLVFRGVVLGILAGSAMLVRTIGFTLVFGLALEMLLRRRWSQLFGFCAAVALVLGPWILWSSFHRGGTFHSYASENAITWQTPISHFRLLATNTAPALAFAPFESPQWHAIAQRLHLSGATKVLGLTITALVILGWVNLLLRRHVVALVLGPYMAIVFLWWFEPTRFVIPVLPLIVFCAIAGAKAVNSRLAIPAHKTALGAAVICILGGVVVDAVRVERALRYGNIEGAQAAADWKQMQQALNWIRSNTPADAIVFSSYPQAVYLFTSRHTMDLNNDSHIEPVYVPIGQMDLDAQFRKGSGFPSAYVLAIYRWDYLKQMEWSLGPVQRFIASHPGRLEQQWASDDGQLFIYKLASNTGFR
jgi:hypothetical protein